MMDPKSSDIRGNMRKTQYNSLCHHPVSPHSLDIIFKHMMKAPGFATYTSPKSSAFSWDRISTVHIAVR